jgi:hypothetical protein
MGHDHSHSHSHDPHSYFPEQLCTIAACGTLGVVSILVWWQDVLRNILVPAFHLPVLIAGITLLVLALIRGIAVWIEVGRKAEHAHDEHCHHHHEVCCQHEHDHDHQHDHAGAEVSAQKEGIQAPKDHILAGAAAPTAGAMSLGMVTAPEHAASSGPGHHHDHKPGNNHDHDHGHSHGWAPWRYAMLLLPIVLYSLGLPSANRGLSANYVQTRLANDHLEQTDVVKMAVVGNEVVPLEFNTLKQAAYMPDLREQYEGKLGKLKGQFVAGADPKTFSLVRLKMTCCSADAMPLNVVIISNKDLAGIQPMQWVEVTGQIQFRKRKDRDEYLPVIQLRDEDGVVPIDPPATPFL